MIATASEDLLVRICGAAGSPDVTVVDGSERTVDGLPGGLRSENTGALLIRTGAEGPSGG